MVCMVNPNLEYKETKMNTHAAVYFHQVWKDEPLEDATVLSIVSINDNGHPEGTDGMLATLRRFFEENQEQTRFGRAGCRFDDAGLLAARFITYIARKNARTAQGRSWAGQNAMGMVLEDQYIKALDFQGVRPLTEEPGNIRYRYHVWCFQDGQNANQEPFPALSMEPWNEEWSAPMYDTGPGKYRIHCYPLSYGEFKDVAEVVWECNHLIHARNKAAQKGLDVKKIERVEEDE